MSLGIVLDQMEFDKSSVWTLNRFPQVLCWNVYCNVLVWSLNFNLNVRFPRWPLQPDFHKIVLNSLQKSLFFKLKASLGQHFQYWSLKCTTKFVVKSVKRLRLSSVYWAESRYQGERTGADKFIYFVNSLNPIERVLYYKHNMQ